MKLSIICFTLTGLHTAEVLKAALEEQNYTVLLASKSKYLENSIKISTGQWAGERWTADDGIIFVGACGIAVRSIAPWVASKKSDPAVLVIDECGKFVISLLSGHLGGANELALNAAEILKAQPVVTTATDLHSRFAVDVFAKKNGCSIFFMKAAKEVSAALLAGEPVGFYSEFPIEGELPEGLVLCGRDGAAITVDDESYEAEEEVYGDKNGAPDIHTGVAVTVHPSCRPFASTTQVVPKAVTLGMGCRKNKDAAGIETAAAACLETADIYPEALEQLTSISIKKDEPGLNGLAQKWKLPFVTFEAEELQRVEGDFTPSSFVSSVTGVDNVCERSAVLGAKVRGEPESGAGKKTEVLSEAEKNRMGDSKTARGNDTSCLISRKKGENGVTTALAIRNRTIKFS